MFDFMAGEHLHVSGLDRDDPEGLTWVQYVRPGKKGHVRVQFMTKFVQVEVPLAWVHKVTTSLAS